MLGFDPAQEELLAQCVPFGESELGRGEDCQRVHRELKAIRDFLTRRAPDTMACIDSYVDTYLELVDLECRHYFWEGYRLGLRKVAQLRNISTSSTDSPS